jgi:NAD(P)-dependent dehydrogenase (short-subunit alcohol dehydrogenase family)
MPTAIITGASRGFGLALAEQLADAGWNLIINGRTAKTLHAAADRLRTLGSAACRAEPAGSGERVIVEPIVGDITDPAHRAALMRAAQSHGGLDVLINNAGILGPSPLPVTGELGIEALREIIEANVVAPLALTQLALPLLRASHGIVVDITSDAAVEAYPGWGGYGAAKAATEQLRNVLAAEESDVTVWRVDPGDLRTEMHQLAYPGEDISDRALPESVAPGLLRLLAERPASGRYLLAEQSEAPAATGPVALWLTMEVDVFEPVASFYRDVLGLAEIDGWSIDAERGAVFAVGGAARIEVERPGAAPPVSGARAAIEYADLDALTAAHARIAALAGAEPTPVIAHGRGHSGFTIRDPRGTEIYLWSEK